MIDTIVGEMMRTLKIDRNQRRTKITSLLTTPKKMNKKVRIKIKRWKKNKTNMGKC
jgi:hypothetical protein